MHHPIDLFRQRFPQPNANRLLIVAGLLFASVAPIFFWVMPDGQAFIRHYQFAVDGKKARRITAKLGAAGLRAVTWLYGVRFLGEIALANHFPERFSTGPDDHRRNFTARSRYKLC